MLSTICDIFSWDLNSKLVWKSNGPKQFAPWMIHYSSHVLNSKLISHIRMVKSLVTKWHLVTKLFPIIANQMVLTKLLQKSINGHYHLNTKQANICFSDMFAIQVFTIQIPTVYVLNQYSQWKLINYMEMLNEEGLVNTQWVKSRKTQCNGWFKFLNKSLNTNRALTKKFWDKLSYKSTCTWDKLRNKYIYPS